jgi:hypothetical protein
MGIISATGRQLGLNNYEDFIQTDAAINPATPAARWSMPTATWSASTRRSSPSPAARKASASPSRSNWRWK